MSLTVEADHRPKFLASDDLLLALLVAGLAMISMDFSLSSVAIPAIGRELVVPPDLAQWVVSAMSLTYGGSVLVSGRLSDIYGQKKCLISGFTIYTLGALGSGMSAAIVPLIACRALQGIGCAVIFSTTYSLIFHSFPEGPARFRALMISITAQLIATPVGAIVAGKLIAELGWRGAFFTTAPIGFICICLAPRAIRKVDLNELKTQSVDFLGAILWMGGFALIVWSIPSLLKRGDAFSRTSLSGFAAGVVIVGGFLLLQRRRKTPLISPEILHTKNLVPGVIITSIISGVGLTGLIVISLVSVQQGLHFTALEAGFALIPFGISSLLVSFIPPQISRNILRKPRLALIVASAILAGCYFMVSIAADTSSPFLFLSAALILAPIAAIPGINLAMNEALRFVPPEHRGSGTGLLFTGIQLSTALGVSLIVAASEPGKLVPGAASLTAFAGSFRVGAIFCLLGIGVSLLIARVPEVVDAGAKFES